MNPDKLKMIIHTNKEKAGKKRANEQTSLKIKTMQIKTKCCPEVKKKR